MCRQVTIVVTIEGPNPLGQSIQHHAMCVEDLSGMIYQTTTHLAKRMALMCMDSQVVGYIKPQPIWVFTIVVTIEDDPNPSARSAPASCNVCRGLSGMIYQSPTHLREAHGVNMYGGLSSKPQLILRSAHRQRV